MKMPVFYDIMNPSQMLAGDFSFIQTAVNLLVVRASVTSDWKENRLTAFCMEYAMKKSVEDELHRPGIYVIENRARFVKYVGQSCDIAHRWKSHKRDLRKNRHVNQFLQNAWNKYGERHFIFSVLEFCKMGQLDEREQYWIDTLNPEFNIIREVGSFCGVGFQKPQVEPLFYSAEDRDFYRPEWHKYVYGGAKREN